MAKDVACLEALADLSSSGMLYYLGSPQVTLDVSSSGQAVQIEE